MSTKTRNYNNLPFSDYFYIDETSPSGLRWKVDIMGGWNCKSIVVSAGDSAGSLKIATTGLPESWYVTFNGVSLSVHRIIYVLINGSIDSSLVIDHLDGDASNNRYSNLVLKSQRANRQNSKIPRTNTSGVVGVHLVSNIKGDKIYKSWVARYCDSNFKRISKSFSIIRFGYDEAFELAVAYRNEQIKLLNESGQCYTNRHLQTGDIL